MAKKKMFRLGDQTLLSIVGGPTNRDFMDCLIDKKIHKFEFKIQFPNTSKSSLALDVTDVVLERQLENAYFFKGRSEQIEGIFKGFYDPIKHEGWLSKSFDNGLN